MVNQQDIPGTNVRVRDGSVLLSELSLPFTRTQNYDSQWSFSCFPTLYSLSLYLPYRDHVTIYNVYSNENAYKPGSQYTTSILLANTPRLNIIWYRARRLTTEIQEDCARFAMTTNYNRVLTSPFLLPFTNLRPKSPKINISYWSSLSHPNPFNREWATLLISFLDRKFMELGMPSGIFTSGKLSSYICCKYNKSYPGYYEKCGTSTGKFSSELSDHKLFRLTAVVQETFTVEPQVDITRYMLLFLSGQLVNIVWNYISWSDHPSWLAQYFPPQYTRGGPKTRFGAITNMRGIYTDSPHTSWIAKSGTVLLCQRYLLSLFAQFSLLYHH